MNLKFATFSNFEFDCCLIQQTFGCRNAAGHFEGSFEEKPRTLYCAT